MLSEDIGNNYSLRTENTKTIVAALNEIKGKDIISNAVGSPLVFDDTFEVMGEKINGLTSNFKSKLLGLGVSVSSVDKLESLISKLDGIDLGADAGEILTPFIETLSGILADEGVILNGNETLGELIIKVDERFDELHSEINELETELAGKVTPAGTAVAGDVLSGKTFINSTGQTITGTIANRGGAQTVTPGTSNKTLNAGYYSGNITVKGDSNLKASNIVSGKSIFGVNGTAASLPSGSNIIYNSGTINTDVIGGFDFFMEDFDSIASSVTYNSDSIELASVINSGGQTPNADYIISHRAIRPYPYTKLRLTYKTIASEETDYYRAFYSVDFAKFTPSTYSNDGLLDYRLSFPYSTGLYGTGLYDDYTEVTTVDIDIPDNLDTFFLVFRAQHIHTAANTLRLVIYKIELI
jgi:hypothetical protein